MAAISCLLLLFAFGVVRGLENKRKTSWELYGIIYSTYQYNANQECLNNDLNNIQGVSFYDCQKYCADRSYCSGFNFNDQQQRTSRSNCSTKIGSCSLGEKDDFHLYSKRGPASADAFTVWGNDNGYEYHSESECQGGRLSHDPMATLDDCRRLCSEVHDCFGFLWNENGNCLTKKERCQMKKKRGSDRRHFFEEDWGWEHWTTGCTKETLSRGVVREMQSMNRKRCMRECNTTDWCGGFSHDIKSDVCRLRIGRCQKAVPRLHEGTVAANSTNAFYPLTHYYNKPSGKKESSQRAEITDRLLSWAIENDYIYGASYCPMEDQSDVIANRQSMSVDKCKDACNSDSTCSMFVYNLVENSCRLMRSSCLSEDTPGDSKLQVFEKAAALAQLLAATSGFKLGKNLCPGPRVRPLRTSKIDCLLACNKSAWCGAVSYNLTSGDCFQHIAHCFGYAIPDGYNYKLFSLLKPVNQSLEKQRFASWAKAVNFTYSGYGYCRYTGEYDYRAKDTRPPTPYHYLSNATFLSTCLSKCLDDRWCLGFTWYTNNTCSIRRYLCKPYMYIYKKEFIGHHFERDPEEAAFAATIGYEYRRGVCSSEVYRFIKDLNMRACYQACASEPLCGSFTIRMTGGCRLMIGDCERRSIDTRELGHTFIKPDSIKAKTRFYAFTKQLGFNGTRGYCAERSPVLDTISSMDLSGCALSCMNKSDCLQFTFSESYKGAFSAGICVLFREACKIVGVRYYMRRHVYQRGGLYESYRYDVRGGDCNGTRNLVSDCIPGKSIEECAALCTERRPCNAFDHVGAIIKGTACCRLFNVLELSSAQCKPHRPTFVSVNFIGPSSM